MSVLPAGPVDAEEVRPESPRKLMWVQEAAAGVSNVCHAGFEDSDGPVVVANLAWNRHEFTGSESRGPEKAKWQVAVLVSPLVGIDSRWEQLGREVAVHEETTVKKDADGQRRNLERELDAGRRAETEMTWSDFAKDFLDKHAGRKPATTLALYKHCLEIFDTLAKPKRLAKVTHSMLEDFTINRLKDKAAAASCEPRPSSH